MGRWGMVWRRGWAKRPSWTAATIRRYRPFDGDSRVAPGRVRNLAMPFDGTGWNPQPTPEPAPRKAQERVMTVVIAFIVVLLFVLPISAGTLVDIVESMRAG